MITSGLVITFSAEPGDAARACDELGAAGPFVLGEGDGPIRAAVLEAENQAEALDWHHWAQTRPGVLDVEVVFVHWDEEASHAGA